MCAISLIDHLCHLIRGKPLEVHMLNIHLLVELFMKFYMSIHVDIMTSVNRSLVNVLLIKMRRIRIFPRTLCRRRMSNGRHRSRG